ncbi:MAG: tRNA-dihydrouridine synthase [Clostridia bacterium]|nr:tRNA-dihydrouridine synthase [Clostridia bacterium]
MKIKSIKIGGVTTKNNVFFAPLAGFSDSAMRKIAVECGAGLTFTEMVSCKGLKYTPSASSELLHFYPEETPKAVQIFGSDPEIMGEIAKSEYLAPFDIIDINMGCPVPKIYSNGEGSALLNDIYLAQKIITQVKKAGKPVSVKFRIGLTENSLITRDFSLACQDAGADLITIHGRTRDKYYSGTPNYFEIESAKNAVKIPVIANGGIFTVKDANDMMEKTGADGVMLARGALENPLLFCDILGIKHPKTLKELIVEQANLLKERYGVERSAIMFRKQAAYYLKGVIGGRKLRDEIFSSTNINEVISMILSANF